MTSAPPFTSHPCLPELGLEHILQFAQANQCSAEAAWQRIEHQRREAIRLAKADPFRHGFELDWWKDADRLIAEAQTTLLANLGGNGSAKTTRMVKRGVQVAFQKQGAKVLFLHEDEKASIDVHQGMAYTFLPNELKPRDGVKIKRSVSTNIQYDTKNGFVGSAFTTPNGGKVMFGNYRQQLKSWEGGGWTRIYADENFPLGWLQTLLYRLGRMGGKMEWSFTAIEGITPGIYEIRSHARTLEWKPVDARLLPATHVPSGEEQWKPGHMPYVQQAADPRVKILYAHSILNPLGGYAPEEGRGAWYDYEENLVPLLMKRPVDERERRAYGWTRKGKRAAFPRASDLHWVDEDVMEKRLAAVPTTSYMIMDPAGARNCFLIWFAVDEHGWHYVYNEWPDVETVGQWALPSDDAGKFDGKQGPAQDSMGYGITDYKRLMLEAEGWRFVEGVWVPYELSFEVLDGQKVEKRKAARQVWQRFIDPRSGAVEAMASEEGESSLIDRFLEEQTDEKGHIVGPSMEFEPAYSGRSEDDGLQQINELLAYDATQPMVALLNEPRLLVSKKCQNVIWAMTHYTARDGAKAACKDPIDCLRYMALKNCIHVQASALAGHKGGGWR